MDRRSVIGINGEIHEGLFNSYTGSLIGFTCGSRHHDILRLNSMPDSACLTDGPVTCDGCLKATTGTMAHPATVARMCADAVLAEADGRGYPPTMDDEGLRLAFTRLAPDAGELRPLFERLARGVYDPENSYRRERLYDLIREHLADAMTARALEAPAEPIPDATVEYTRFTGGKVMAPLGVGDRVMRTAYASGLWWFGSIVGTEGEYALIREDGSKVPFRYKRRAMGDLFAKLDRAPLPAAV